MQRLLVTFLVASPLVTACKGGDTYSDIDASSNDAIDGDPDAQDPPDGPPDAEPDAAPDAGPTAYLSTYGSAGFEAISMLHVLGDEIVFAGSIGGDAMLGTIPLDYEGGSDWVIGRLDGAGEPTWAAAYGSTANDLMGGTALTASGDLVVAGAFGGTANYGGSNLVAAGSYDLFIAKYDGDTGAHQWSVRYGGTNEERITDVAVDAAGDVYVSGYFSTSTTLGGSTLTSAGGTDAFIAKYNGTNGAYVWGFRHGSTGNDYANAIHIDGDDLLVGGRFRETVNFGGSALASAGLDDIFVASYATASGAHQWSQRFGGTSNDNLTDIVAASGAVYVTGQFAGSVNFGGNTLTAQVGPDMYLAKYDGATGSHVWSRRYGDGIEGEVRASRLRATASALLVAGKFDVRADLGGGNLNSAGGEDIFIAELSTADAAHVYSERFGGTSNDQALDVAPIGSGLVFSGSFQGVTYFGSTQATSAGGSDAFVYRP